jgi:hypothetical protein
MEAALAPVIVTVKDSTSKGTFDAAQIFNTIWSLRYQALYHYNRSPWVEHGYCRAIGDVQPDTGQAGVWVIELLDTSDQPGALGYHEDKAHTSQAHATRGLAANSQTPLAKVFCKTSREDGIAPTEVASHEMLEMLVDPYVVNEADVYKVLNTAAKQFYIVEVGDPVQGRGYAVGAPEGRPESVIEAIVADFAYPAWWGLQQTRPFTSAAAEFALSPDLKSFELAPGGYMSVAPEASPGEWSQIYGSDRPKAEASAHAFERPGEVG